MPVLHEDSRIIGLKHRLPETATKDLFRFLSANISNCSETAKFSFTF